MKGKTALVTGSTSGIGLGPAPSLAGQGAWRDAERLRLGADAAGKAWATTRPSALTVFLCTDAAINVLGQAWSMDGGWTAV